jgi:hypothetical protein
MKAIRYYNIGIASSIITDLTTMFVDEKDSNSKLILSQIYLVLGLSFPFWMTNINGELSFFELLNLY